MKPMLLINLKTYEQGTGENALRLARIADEIARKSKENIVLSAQAADIGLISKGVKIPVYAQHMDPIEPGSHTGWTLPQSVKAAGAAGTLINHSEHRIKLADVKKCVDKCRQLRMVAVCCAATPKIAKQIAGFGPDYIAIEPPELIGGTVSVSQAKPAIISDTVEAVSRVNDQVKVLCGAGVHCKDDVQKAIELGSVGILVASGIVKSKKPDSVIMDLIRGFY